MSLKKITSVLIRIIPPQDYKLETRKCRWRPAGKAFPQILLQLLLFLHPLDSHFSELKGTCCKRQAQWPNYMLHTKCRHPKWQHRVVFFPSLVKFTSVWIKFVVQCVASPHFTAHYRGREVGTGLLPFLAGGHVFCNISFHPQSLAFPSPLLLPLPFF